MGTLTTCNQMDGNTVLRSFTPCSCTSGKVCSITIQSGVASFNLLTVQFGPLTNPPAVENQNVYVTIKTSTPISNQQIITSDKFSPGTLIKTSITQASEVVGNYN